MRLFLIALFLFELIMAMLSGNYAPAVAETDTMPKPNLNQTGEIDWVFEKGSIYFPKGRTPARIGPQISNASAPANSVSIEDKAYFLSSTKWDSTSIYVCWENPSNNDASERKLVQESISGTWQLHSQLQFKGWGKCSPTSSGIRIKIEDSGPHTKGLGKTLDGKVDGMVLNFTYNIWSPSCRKMKPACDASIAVHEFGHALGFAHEQNRPDTPGECAHQPQGTSGDRMLTPWDLYSVMNYCSPVYNNDGKLSVGDIAALQYIYGKPAH